jgi:transcriptional regulator with GAF, ATPase, and Fis domain
MPKTVEKKLFDVEVEAIIKRYLEKNDWKLQHTAEQLGITTITCRKLARRGGFWPHQPARS